MNKPARHLAIFLLVILASGCVQGRQSTTLQLTQTKIATTTEQPAPSQTISHTPNQPLPSNTPRPTVTPTRSLQPPTPAPIPTLSDTQIEALVLDLLHNNTGCELPCWWGFTPGETSWETVRDFFVMHGVLIENRFHEEKPMYIIGFRVDKHNFGTGATFFVDNGVVRVIKAGSETFIFPETLLFGDPFFLEAMERYTISSMLAQLGKPSQVLLLVEANRTPQLPDYHFLLYYPIHGVLLNYDGRSSEFDNKIQLCPGKASIHMWLWSPRENFTLEDVSFYEWNWTKDNTKRYLDRFLSWEKVTNTSIESFVETFKIETACFETSATLWERE